ncbi:MAG: hypothetical protein EON93_06005, partial [Burkholderiales bacterium]
MATSSNLEFINRESELGYLLRRLGDAGAAPALVVVRSPAGFGKSSLTDRLEEAAKQLGRSFCTVDPNVRGRTGSVSPYDGFFLQRIAEQLDRRSQDGDAPWRRFANYLSGRRWKSASEKSPFDIVADVPTPEGIYKLAFDYISRAFFLGNFSAKNLLVSDQAHAVTLCSDYVGAALAETPSIVVVRQAHHIDLHSLRALLQMNAAKPGPDIIFEYTSDDGRFEPEHQKLLLRAADEQRAMEILDLVRLEPQHLELLIRKHVHSDFTMTSDYYLAWSGDLRSVTELKCKVAVGQSITSSKQIGRALGNLSEAITDHISQLSPLERVVLATVLAHVEGIDRSTLSAALSAIDPRMSQSAAAKAIERLEGVHLFLSISGGSIRIRDETVARALNEAVELKGRVALSERALRDHYRGLVFNGGAGAGLAGSVRQYFRLCARTRDVAGLLAAVERLSEDVRLSQDQSIYVDIVSSAIESDSSLHGEDHEGLIDWAAALAYGVCDWPRAESLLRLRSRQNAFSKIMRACALQEIGRHDDALRLAGEVRASAQTTNEELAAALVEALVIGCRGQHERSRAILMAMIDRPEFRDSPLIGFAYRFFEIVDGFLDALPRLRVSVACFAEHGFDRAKAYSQLPVAMFLARMGETTEAFKLIDEAQTTLAGEVRDHHMVLNNRSAVMLLSNSPQFAAIRNDLLYALRLARDDFTELTILTNLALAYLGGGEMDAALSCAERCMGILESHDFADTDIYWPVCFNASVVFAAAGDAARRDAV